MAEVRHRCSQPGCTVETDGKCLEGLTPEECTFYQAMEAAAAEGQNSPVRKDRLEAGSISFHDGEYLNEASSRPLTRMFLTRVIVLAGEVGSGKTTLLATLNDAFQKGPFGGYDFAGSLTLPAFERICHQARLASGRLSPKTERTKPTPDIQFLHLAVRSGDTDRTTQHLLLADISGERLEQLRDSATAADSFTVLQRADHIVLLFDGRKMSDPELRQAARTNGLMFLRSAADSGLMTSNSFLDVVFSKWDLIEAGEENNRVKNFVGRIRADIEERFGANLGRLRFFELAARPDLDSSLPFAYGVSAMFEGWVETSPLTAAPVTKAIPFSGKAREFTRY
jgi:energy-coupling factor transporter ATP-binding protein EcfA2